MPRVLVVAGSDSGGGAGIQGDIKTITALGGYAASALTALTAQNTQGIADILAVPAEFVRRQMTMVIDDIGVDAIKTGMLHRADVIATVVEVVAERASLVPLVVDPVMVATGGQRLLDPAAQDILVRRLLPLVTLLTPNIPEAEALSGLRITDTASMIAAGHRLRALGAAAVLVKGGHRAGPRMTDVLVTATAAEMFEDSRIDTRSTHGTGCALASAIADGLARKLPLSEAVARARAYLRRAIATAPGFGSGQGPLNHGHPCGSSSGLPGTRDKPLSLADKI